MNANAKQMPAASEAYWDLHSIIGQLRAVRDHSLAARQRLGKPVKLPSRKSLASIVEKLSIALFPNRLSARQLSVDTIDYFVGHTLDGALRELVEQVQQELQFNATDNSNLDVLHAPAQNIVRRFSEQLPKIRQLLDSDIQAAYEGDPAARSIDEVLGCYPGITAVIHYRLAHALYTLGTPLIARIISEAAHATTGVDIHPGAEIAESFFIDHGTGVVIGETAIIGKRVRLYHGVTLGAKKFAMDVQGRLVKGNARHPIVEDDVVVYAGATILGRITIGRGSVIGGNVWLTASVPPNSNVSQAKVRCEDFDGGSGI